MARTFVSQYLHTAAEADGTLDIAQVNARVADLLTQGKWTLGPADENVSVRLQSVIVTDCSPFHAGRTETIRPPVHPATHCEFFLQNGLKHCASHPRSF
jgi:hypothetical protein